MNYVCENYEINKEKAEDRSAALAAYAGKIVLGTKEKEKKFIRRKRNRLRRKKKKMLNFNEFQEHIKNTILDYLPEEFSDAKVDLQQVAKNNETLTGIIIHQEKVNISPTIYLDPFYKEYMSGSKDLDTVMGEIGQIYVQNAPDNNFDVSRITDFELVNRERKWCSGNY